MKYLISITQGSIISILLIPVFLVVGYILYKFIKKNFTKDHESRMLSLNLVITYPNFIKYITYKESIKEDFALYMVSINNFVDLTKKYNEKIIKAYVRRVVKNLSTTLPYGGKLAQTKKRDTFIMYVPNIYGNELEFANVIKEASFEPLVVNGKPILENIAIGYTTASAKPIAVLVDEANQALVASKRDLNTITRYTKSLVIAKEDHIYVTDRIDRDEYKITISDVIRDRNHREESFLMSVVANNLVFDNYLLQIAQADRLWVNMNIVLKVLDISEKYYIEKPIYLPFLISTLESKGFIENLETMLATRGIEANKVVLMLYPNTVYKQELIVENLLRLKETGFKFAYHLEPGKPQYTLFVEKYHISKILIDLEKNQYDPNFLEEISNYAQVNQVETIIKGDMQNMISFTHYLKELDLVKINEKVVKVKKIKDKKRRQQ